jgi:hypothetical protein
MARPAGNAAQPIRSLLTKIGDFEAQCGRNPLSGDFSRYEIRFRNLGDLAPHNAAPYNQVIGWRSLPPPHVSSTLLQEWIKPEPRVWAFFRLVLSP